MKNVFDNYTEDDAIRGVKTYQVVLKGGKVELEEVDSFYLMAQEELKENTPIRPVPIYCRGTEEFVDTEAEDFCMTSEERRAIYPVRETLRSAAEAVREAYTGLEAACKRPEESGVFARESIPPA